MGTITTTTTTTTTITLLTFVLSTLLLSEGTFAVPLPYNLANNQLSIILADLPPPSLSSPTAGGSSTTLELETQTLDRNQPDVQNVHVMMGRIFSVRAER